jgi:hypothetical protein
LTNLRTVQDWIVQRRLLTVPGVVQVNTWGGTTKEYGVEVDLNKLDAYGVTLPDVISAIGNAVGEHSRRRPDEQRRLLGSHASLRAATLAWACKSPLGYPSDTRIRRICAGCCDRAASGHRSR